MNTDLNDLLIFTRVAAVGSLAGAARGLGLPKSTVSHRMQQLEARLGARLIERTTRRLALTEIGAAYLARCQRIVAELEDAEAFVAGFKAEPAGTLRISAPLEIGTYFLGGIVARFMQQHPRVQVEIDLSSRFADLVEDGFDLAIRAGTLADSSLIARPLFQAPRRLVASPGYLAQHGSPTSPSALDEHHGVGPGSVREPLRWALNGAGGRIEAKLKCKLAVGSLSVQREAAIAGLGIARLPDFVCRDALANGELVAVLPDWQPDPVPLQAVYPSRRLLTPKVSAFLDFLERELLRLLGTPGA
ncbi:LysR family transcriptional regulator [Niveibacterium umoris]|uniref:DNA-binding transcriptional LysR family regulator n=1 Tax=Niveibacterium umoris TaxID=1193620 RepID=A0A840BJI1_9RHOO|nr:LysR family transcriptional regulator [Niveibacterium umoris]MBB4013691.1 DNA-binding transcriptional LysR family regulator [Niveibacterium umoris]